MTESLGESPNIGDRSKPRATPPYAEIKYRRAILDACPIDIYVSSNIRTYWWPYRLQHVGYAEAGVRWMASKGYILDSNVNDQSVTNADVLDRAADLEATYVIPKDYRDDQARTTESVLEFLELYDDHDFGADFTRTPTPMIPLQPPYDTHYQQLDSFDHYVLGGIKDRDPEDQLAAIRQFRAVAGDDVHAHALGMGASLELIQELRADPGLLDSLDLSTPEQLARGGAIPDEHWQQRDLPVTGGDLSTAVRGLRSAWIATRLAYELSELPNADEHRLTGGSPVEATSVQTQLPTPTADGGQER